MLIPTMVMAILAAVALYIGYSKGQGQHIAGLKMGGAMILEIFPLLVFALILAGMVQVLISQAFIARWVGSESGFRGIMIGSLAGALTPGGPFVCMPLVAGLIKAGAGSGTAVAYITGWSVWAIARLPLEIGLLGPRFTFVRLSCSLLLPPLAGWMAIILFPKG
ncbi:permease [candidate division CSSED10-310 bacterium]|uniref:Permease n=1 Tax=candidate division CSSED10-310 bacterium TaxID=2855610 RepID=A0ABV6Z4T0_UNCC1